MHLYRTRDHFDAQLGGVKKWMRTGQALDLGPTLLQNVAYSIGDSLTYWWDTADRLASDVLTGHRRYLTVLAPFSGELTVMVASKAMLRTIEPYSDLTDRERFDGPASAVAVPEGGVVVLDVDEASKVLPSDAKVIQVQVTVEGYSFPNK